MALKASQIIFKGLLQKKDSNIMIGVFALFSCLVISIIAWTLRAHMTAFSVLFFLFSPLSWLPPIPGIVAFAYGCLTSCRKMAFAVGAIPVFLSFFLDLAEYTARLGSTYLPGSLLPPWTSLLGAFGCGFWGYSAG